MSNSDINSDNVRSSNIGKFKAMLMHLGNRDYDNCSLFLTEDVYADWPYRPMPTIPDRVSGRDNLIAYFRGDIDGSHTDGLDEFTPLSYEIENIHQLVDPNVVIAEYSSHAQHIPSGKPYNNKYVGIMKFDSGKICYWREYVNPAVIYEIYDMVKLPE